MRIVVFLRHKNPNTIIQLKMKRTFLAIMVVAAGLMMTACFNNSSNNNNPNDNGNKKNEVTPVQPEGKVVADPSGIDAIRKTWAKGPFDLDKGDIDPDIETFAFAICKKFPTCKTNKAMMDYLMDPKGYNNEEYKIESSPRNGYIHCMRQVQTTPITDVCFWNRKNGNKLVAAYMEDTHESGEWAERLVVFYDYDPATDVMTPEPALTKMIENRIKSFDTYAVVLPKEGKDIKVIGYVIDEENDSADAVNLQLKWDGNTFDWVN